VRAPPSARACTPCVLVATRAHTRTPRAHHAHPPTHPPPAAVFKAAQAHWLSACLHVMLELKVADVLVQHAAAAPSPHAAAPAQAPAGRAATATGSSNNAGMHVDEVTALLPRRTPTHAHTSTSTHTLQPARAPHTHTHTHTPATARARVRRQSRPPVQGAARAGAVGAARRAAWEAARVFAQRRHARARAGSVCLCSCVLVVAVAHGMHALCVAPFKCRVAC
jgi:hypothetical protein